jgi:hypothetical protein
MPFFDRASARQRPVVGEAVREVAKADLWPEFRGQSGEAIGPAPSADTASDTDDHKGVVGEAVPAVQAQHVRSLF